MNPISGINNKIDHLKLNYYGAMSISVVAGSAYASVAIMLIAMTNQPMWQTAIISTTAMAANAAAIASMPLRWIGWTFIINMIATTILIIINLI